MAGKILDSQTNELHTQIQYKLIEKLTESERRYYRLLENLREVVFECDQNGCLSFINKAWTETLGYSTKDALGQSLGSFICEDDREVWQTNLQHQVDSCVELRFRHQNGEILWLETSMRFSEGSKLSGSLVNITARKQAAAMMQQTNEVL